MDQFFFDGDMTLRLSCREGDFLMWCSYTIFSNRYIIKDFWQLRDGDFVTITNKQVDLPPWFELHPTETTRALIPWMREKLNSGYEPLDPVEVPNLWRALDGDRLIWVGKKRQGIPSDNGLFSILTFRENAAIIGQSSKEGEYDLFSDFGGFGRKSLSKENEALCKRGWEAMLKLGMPRSAAADGQWAIGHK